MSSSIHTNRSALQALQAVNAAGRDLASAQNKVSTGLKIATAKDNGAVFAIASTMRADIGGWGVVKSGLNRVQSITDVALMGTERIGELLIELQQHAVTLNDSISGASRRAVVDHMMAMIKEIDQIARTTAFDGVNLLTGKPTVTTTTTHSYGLPSSPLPQPAFSSMAALPPNSFAWPSSTVSYTLPPSPQTPASFDQAVAAISGSNSQTVAVDGGTDTGRVNLLLAKLAVVALLALAAMGFMLLGSVLENLIKAAVFERTLTFALTGEAAGRFIGFFGLSWLRIIQFAMMGMLAAVVTRSLLAALFVPLVVGVAQFFTPQMLGPMGVMPDAWLSMLVNPGASIDAIQAVIAGGEVAGALPDGLVLKAWVSVGLWTLAPLAGALAWFRKQDLSKE